MPTPSMHAAVRPRAGAVASLVTLVLISLVPLAAPARASDAFIDDDSSPHESAIEYIADEAVTNGCNPPANDRYCPERRVTRAEMAAFMQRAFDLPSGTKNRFEDDDGSPFESAINAAGKAGVSLGCNPPANDRFCPGSPVTRGEMAAFLNRLLDLDPGGDFFGDDRSSVFEGNINSVARVGISRGCNPPANDWFCPRRSVTRGEMATFLQRAMVIHRTGVTTTIDPNPTDPPPAPPGSAECSAVGAPLSGPSNPRGDVVIKPGQSIQAAVNSHGEGTVFVIAAGVHKNQTVSPKHDQRFIGQPGAVLDGGGTTEYAFGGPGDDVVIQGLEIRNYDSEIGAGVIRSVHSSFRWTVRENDIHHNGGQAINVNHRWKVIGNHLHDNEQFGIGGQGDGILIEKNEISFNNSEMEVNPYHGAGGTKIRRTEDLVVRSNCSHDNGGPGLWTDGYNINTLYERNVVFGNRHAGIKHEVSCSAAIRSNVAVRNGFGNPNWLAGAGIVVINSPGVTVTGNVVRDNADGIAGIQGVRDLLRGDDCQFQLKDLSVYENKIEMSTGYTGVVTNETSSVFGSWNNRFWGNEYVLRPSGAEFFSWDGEHLTLPHWKAAGQG